jgi:hypothetical protein
MPQLFGDCLNEIFEYLENDNISLHSCLLVNRLWCEVSVRILWRNIWNYNNRTYNTLISCLPNESKEILFKNEIIISTPTSKSPSFNYASFCKILSITRVHYKIEHILKNQRYSQNQINLVTQEIFKLFAKHISSLKQLDLSPSSFWQTRFISYPGANNCLENLSKLYCRSSIDSKFFCQLSQICHNVSLLDILVDSYISSGLAELISVQKNLKYFVITLSCYDLTDYELTNIIPSLMIKLPNTLIKLDLNGRQQHYISLSLVANFSNLQELVLSFGYKECFEDFERLQYAIFPKLQILKIEKACPRYEFLINFLENNGNNLKEIYIGDIRRGCSDNSLNLAIAKFCPNLRKLSTGIKNYELKTLKIIFDSCQNLESINIWCGGEFLSEKEALEMVVKYSQNIRKLILYNQSDVQFKLLSGELLESFFINWTNRIPLKSLSIVVVNYDTNSLDTNDIINKYRELGIIKEFRIIMQSYMVWTYGMYDFL